MSKQTTFIDYIVILGIMYTATYTSIELSYKDNACSNNLNQ